MNLQGKKVRLHAMSLPSHGERMHAKRHAPLQVGKAVKQAQ